MSQPETEKVRGMQSGYVLDNRYEIVSLVGSGGMGVVYKVRQTHFDKFFALKTLLSRNLSSQALVRFQQEAKAVSNLNHAGLIKLYDFGLTDEGTPFMVMDFVEGGSLADAIKQAGQLPLERVLRIFVDASDALAHAHQRGIIHRDLKPSNILLEKSEQFEELVKIVDFGVAKMLENEGDNGLTLTRTGEFLGSPLYMSPEQCSGKPADQRSDVYSLGCSMFEALTGGPPFQGDSALAILLKHQNETAPALAEVSLGKSFPKDLEDVIGKALSKDANARYQSAREFCSALFNIEGADYGIPPRAQARLSPRRKEKRKPIIVPLPVMMLLTLSAILFSSLATTIYLRFASRRPDAQNVPAGPLEPNRINTAFFEDRKPTQIHSDKTEKIGNERTIHFPDKFSLGGLSIMRAPYSAKPIGQAIGACRIPVDCKLSLRPSWIVCEDPTLFDRFAPDDFYEINFQNVPPLDDHVLSYIAKLKGLHALNLTSTNITDEGLKYLLDMPNLDELYLSSTSITGEGIASLSKLKSLKILALNNLKLDESVFDYLSSGPRLKFLELRQVDLGNEDLQYLTNLKSLTVLRVQDNEKITDEGLKYLAKLPGLVNLDLRGCKITPAALRYLKLMPKLAGITLTDNMFAPAELARVKRELPKVAITLVPRVKVIEP